MQLPKISTLLLLLPVKETLKGSLTDMKMEGCPCLLPSNTPIKAWIRCKVGCVVSIPGASEWNDLVKRV